jgi:hypothetical protein
MRGIAATCRAKPRLDARPPRLVFERLGAHRDLYDLDIADVTTAALKRPEDDR